MKTSRFISLLLCVVMIMSLFTGLAGPASADDVIIHEVQSGEILMKICEKYGLNYYNSKNAIMALNGFTSEAQLGKLTVGQKLKLPASTAVAGTVSTATAVVTSTTIGGTTMTTTSYVGGSAAGGSVAFYLVPYTVKNGDTLNKICNELGSNYYYYSPVIQGINALANPNQIKAGQVLLIPTASATGATSAVVGHVVQAGETITSIANKYGLNYQVQRALINGLNRRDNMDKIYVGQTVLIPSASVGVGTTVTTTTSAATAAATAAASGNYQISITAAANGSPYVVVNNTQFATRANAGETVNIVPSPKAGYAVRDIQVIRTDSGTDIPVSNYTFTMPNSSVQVTVFYSRGFVINKVASPYGTFDTMIYGTNANTAFFGDEIALAIYPKKGYNVKYPVGDVTGVYYQKSDLSMERVYIKPDKADGLYKFKMPNYEIRLTVVFEISSYYSLTSSVPSGGGSVIFYVDGVQTTRAMQGQTVIMQMVPANGWVFDSNTYENSAGFAILKSKVSKITKVNNTSYQFVMGSELVSSGAVVFLNNNSYALQTDVKGGHGWVSFQLVDDAFNVAAKDITRAQPNWLVEVVLHPDNEWAFTDSTEKPDSDTHYMVNNSRGNFSKAQLNAGLWASMATRYIFRMPAEDVTIVAKFTQDKSKIYYDLNVNYDHKVGTAVAYNQYGQPITKAIAGQEVTIKVTAADNVRVAGIQWQYENSGDNNWLPNVDAAPGHEYDHSKTWTAKLPKHASWDTVNVVFEENAEYATIWDPLYPIDTRDSGVYDGDRTNIAMLNLPLTGTNARIGTTINFSAVAGNGYSVGEVWAARDDGVNPVVYKMLAPTEAGGNNYTYTVTGADKGTKLSFIAVRTGKEPVHYIIPEFTIAETGITNIGPEPPLYTICIADENNHFVPVADIGQVYGMGAVAKYPALAIRDRDIKHNTGVKIQVKIPKAPHKYIGADTVLIYQVDTLTIRFSDYVLDNYKVLQDGTDEFTYEFWYQADDPLTDLNIMVNYKELGTSDTVSTDSGALGTPSITINGTPVSLSDGQGTIRTSDGKAVITITANTP